MAVMIPLLIIMMVYFLVLLLKTLILTAHFKNEPLKSRT